MKLSFQKLFYTIATIIAIFAILFLAKSILIPLCIALLMSFILFPLAKKFESLKMGTTPAAFLSILVVFLIIGGIIVFFSTQIIELSNEFTHFKDKIILSFADVTLYFNNNVNFIENLGKDDLINKIKDWLANSTGSLISKTFTNTSTFLVGLLATIVFTFLILIYRTGFTQAFIAFAPEDKRGRVLKMLKSVQEVGQKYLFGMIVLTIVIGLANSIGLWIIGIDNPFLFGFLGSALAIIPYIGTTIGAIIPVIYAFVSFDSSWMAIAVAILFWGVQLISDNFLSPKIVGGSLKLNALTAILSLFIGAVVWGIAGMILFLPFAAMLKVVCEEFDELKPVALLIGSQNDNGKEHKNYIGYKWIKKIRLWVSNIHLTLKK